MTNIQLYLAIGIPIIAILTSLTVSLLQISAIRAEVARIHEDMRGLRADFREDMKGMYADFREDMRAIRTDLNTLTGKVIEMDNRLTRIEERLEHR